MTEVVTISVSGQRWTAWKQVSVRAAVKEAARAFSLVIAAEAGAAGTAAMFAVMTPVQIYANGDLLLDGYIDRRRPHIGPRRADIAISGRARGQDAIDSTAMHPTGRFENKTPLDIAQELDKHSIGFSSAVDLVKLPEFQLQPGETLFRTLERLARDQDVTLAGQADGSIRFWNASKTPPRHAGGLFEGQNIEEGEADHNAANRHSHVHVRGQKYQGHGDAALRIESVATDDDVPRYRPQVIHQDGDTDKDRSRRRARHHRDRKAGNGLHARITTPTWRDAAGVIWTPGHIVWLESAFLDVTQDMILESVDFEQDAEGRGTQAHLGLVDPRAYGGAKGKVNKSGAQWAQDGSEAS